MNNDNQAEVIQNADPADGQQHAAAQQAATTAAPQVATDQVQQANAQPAVQQPAERTFTQEEVNRMMAREKSQGRNAVYNDLGLDPNDGKSIAMVKALLASQKEREHNSNAPEADGAAIEKANQRAALAEAKAEAMMLGVLPEYVEDAVALALPKVGDDTDLKSALAELVDKYPAWTKHSTQQAGVVGEKGTGSAVGANGSSNGTGGSDQGIGARLAATRLAGKPKTSYWKH